VGLAIALFALAIVFKAIPLPAFRQEGTVEVGVRAFRHRHFTWGWLAIFFYVGSEVTVGSILINYLGSPEVMSLPAERADKFLSFYWGGLMIGRLMGAISLSGIRDSRKFPLMVLAALSALAVIFANATFKEKFTMGHFIDFHEILPYLGLVALSFVFFAFGRSQPGRMVGLFAIVAAALTAFSMGTHGQFALWSIVGIGLFNSIMWSNIFTLSIRGLGRDISQGSSLLVMMIVGGAVMPALQGALMDVVGVRWSLAIVLIGYLYLTVFGFFGAKASDSHASNP
jgi:FHS family L-fucose permease-like MFS transporter